MSTDLEWPEDEALPAQGSEWTLLAAAEAFDVDAMQSSARVQLGLYRLPAYLPWAVECLSKRMKKGGKDAAATCALEFGLDRIRQFPGIKEICAARAVVLPTGDPEALSWFDRFGEIDQTTNHVGLLDKAYKRRITERLAKEIGQLAAELGMHGSELGVFALMAAFLGPPELLRESYQLCIVSVLKSLKARLEARAERAREFALAARLYTPADSQYHFSLDDVLGPRRQRNKTPNNP
jgi:hypothetical protein